MHQPFSEISTPSFISLLTAGHSCPDLSSFACSKFMLKPPCSEMNTLEACLMKGMSFNCKGFIQVTHWCVWLTPSSLRVQWQSRQWERGWHQSMTGETTSYSRVQWLRGRVPDSRLWEPGFESCAAVLKPRASFFTLHCSSSLSNINEYLAVDKWWICVRAAFRTLILACGWMLPREVEVIFDWTGLPGK